MRFPFLIETLMQPILFPFGANASTSYADIEGNQLHIKFGSLFDQTLDISKIAKVEKANWPLYYGLGHRLWFGGKVGVLASTRNVVCIYFKEPQYLKAILSLHSETHELYLALQDPDAFIQAFTPSK